MYNITFNMADVFDVEAVLFVSSYGSYFEAANHCKSSSVLFFLIRRRRDVHRHYGANNDANRPANGASHNDGDRPPLYLPTSIVKEQYLSWYTERNGALCSHRGQYCLRTGGFRWSDQTVLHVVQQRLAETTLAGFADKDGRIKP